MKNLLIIALLMTSCTKTLVQPAFQKNNKYKVPVKIEMYAEQMDSYFNLLVPKVEPFQGVWSTGNGYDMLPYFEKGGQVNILLEDVSEINEDGEPVISGQAIIHLSLKPGQMTDNILQGAGTWTTGDITGTLKTCIKEGAGVLEFSYHSNGAQYLTLTGLMRKG